MVVIGIDARQALKERRGIGTCVLKLIQNIARLDDKNTYILYVDRDDEKHLFPTRQNIIVRKLQPSNYIIWEQVSLPLQAFIDKVDILHLAGMTGPLFYPKRLKLIATIYDVTYLKDYEFLPPSSIFYQKIGRIYRKYIVSMLIKKNEEIVTISEFSKNDILGHFPDIDPGRIIVAHLAADRMFKQVDKGESEEVLRSRYGISGKYLLLLGGVDPRKNTRFVIDNYIVMRRENKLDEQLVIVGIPNFRNTEFYKLASDSQFAEDIIFTDHIPDEDLVKLYNCASAFLYPSLFEGFGLPLLEAMACGTCVIASNTSCIPEVVGDAGILIDPYNSSDFRRSLEKVLGDEKLRQKLIERGLERVKEFSWEKMAADIHKIYLSLVSQ